MCLKENKWKKKWSSPKYRSQVISGQHVIVTYKQEGLEKQLHIFNCVWVSRVNCWKTILFAWFGGGA